MPLPSPEFTSHLTVLYSESFLPPAYAIFSYLVLLLLGLPSFIIFSSFVTAILPIESLLLTSLLPYPSLVIMEPRKVW